MDHNATNGFLFFLHDGLTEELLSNICLIEALFYDSK